MYSNIVLIKWHKPHHTNVVDKAFHSNSTSYWRLTGIFYIIGKVCFKLVVLISAYPFQASDEHTRMCVYILYMRHVIVVPDVNDLCITVLEDVFIISL